MSFFTVLLQAALALFIGALLLVLMGKTLTWPLFLYLFCTDFMPEWAAAHHSQHIITIIVLALIPTLFYTYTGVWGQMRDWANIAVFFAAALAAFLLDWRLLRRGALAEKWQQVAGLAVLWALAFCFVWCTTHPPALALWRDPTKG